MKKLLTILIPTLLVTSFLMAQEQLELPLVRSKPVVVSKPSPETNLPGLDLPPVSSKLVPNYGPEQATGLPSLSLPPVSRTSPLPTPGAGLPSVNLPSVSPNAPYQIPETRLLPVSLPQTEPDVVEPTFEDFTGGWNTEDFPDNIDDKDASEIENFVWSKRGRLEPRRGYAFYNGSEIESGEHAWGLYRHYKRNRRSVLYVGLPDSLYVDTSQAQSGSFLSTGYGWTDNEEFFDFETFKDYCIVVHRGDTSRIFDELDLVTPTFGFADSFTQSVCDPLPFNGCSTFICADDVDWIPNQWAGYWVCKDLNPHDDNDYWTSLPQLIVANTESRLILAGLGSVGLGFGWKYIFSFFDYDSVATVVVDSVHPATCGVKLILTSWTTADTVWDGATHVIRMTSGNAKGQESDILLTTVGSDTTIYFHDFFGDADEIASGDTAVILRNTFWKAEFVKAHKNRLFLVVRNNWPTSGQFIVFSEYNSVTHFDKDNYFFIRTDDGDKVTQLATFYQDQLGYKDNARDGLVIFKENSIFTLTFIGATNYYLTQVVEGVGCMAGQTVQVIEGKYMLFLHSTGEYVFDGRTVTLISQKIDSEIEKIERSPDHDECAAGYDDRHYYLSCPSMVDISGLDVTPWGFLVGFDMDRDASDDGLWTHHIDSAGEAVGSDAYHMSSSAQNYIDIAMDTLGNYVGVWKNFGDNGDVYLTRFDYDGDSVGNSLPLCDGSRATRVHTNEITVDMDNDENIIVCWTDNPVAGFDDTWCQYVDWTDGKVDTNFVVNSDWETNLKSCAQVDVGMNTNGIAVVVWQDARNFDDEAYEIYSQIYDVPDSAIGGNASASGGNGLYSDDLCAVGVTGDRYVVSWHSLSGLWNKIQKRVFSIDGASQENAVDVLFAITDITATAVAINAIGNHVVTWQQYVNLYSKYNIWAQKYDSDNSAVGDVFQVSGGLDQVEQIHPAVAINNSNIFVVVWKDSRDAPGDDIYYRGYNWSAVLDTSRYLNDTPDDDACFYPEIDCPDAPYRAVDTTYYSLVWSTIFGGWSKMVNYQAGLYATQKGLADTINMIFSDPTDRSYIYEFGKVFQDTGQDISVLFKSKAFDFNSISNQKRVNRFFINYYLDQGSFDLTFYTDFGGTSQYTSSVSTGGGYGYARVPLDWNCRGRNFSYKIESTDDLRIDKIRLRLKIEED